jgi:hypothetical protein
MIIISKQLNVISVKLNKCFLKKPMWEYCLKKTSYAFLRDFVPLLSVKSPAIVIQVPHETTRGPAQYRHEFFKMENAMKTNW